MPKIKFNSDDPDFIKITHYINPHMFWYKYEESFISNPKLTSWEDKLQKCFAGKPLHPNAKFIPKIGETVAVYNFTFNRWIRAKCDNITEYAVDTTKYIMWAIDYGIPFQTIATYTRRMPSDVGEPAEETVFFGGMNKIVPIEKEFNFDTFTAEFNPKSKWSPLAVRTIENLIFESAHIRFVREIISRDGQYFGELEFITHTNKTIKAKNCLTDIHHARFVEDFFPQLRQISTTKIPRWQTNERISFVAKFNSNKLSNIAELNPNQTLIPKDRHDFHAQEIAEKISDWTMRNTISQQVDTDDVESLCESTVSFSIARKIAMEKLPVEKEEPPVVSRPKPHVVTGSTLSLLSSVSTSTKIKDDDNASNVETLVSEPIISTHALDGFPECPSGISQSAWNMMANRMRHKRRIVLRKLAQEEKQRQKPAAICLPAGYDLGQLQQKREGQDRRLNRNSGFRNKMANGDRRESFTQKRTSEHCSNEQW